VPELFKSIDDSQEIILPVCAVDFITCAGIRVVVLGSAVVSSNLLETFPRFKLRKWTFVREVDFMHFYHC